MCKMVEKIPVLAEKMVFRRCVVIGSYDGGHLRLTVEKTSDTVNCIGRYGHIGVNEKEYLARRFCRTRIPGPGGASRFGKSNDAATRSFS